MTQQVKPLWLIDYEANLSEEDEEFWDQFDSYGEDTDVNNPQLRQPDSRG